MNPWLALALTFAAWFAFFWWRTRDMVPDENAGPVVTARENPFLDFEPASLNSVNPHSLLCPFGFFR